MSRTAEDRLKEEFHAAAGTSLLQRALGPSRSGPAVKIVEVDGCGARLRGVPLALRTLSAEQETRLRADARTWLMESCRYSEIFLDETAVGRAALELEIKVQTLALALVEPASPHGQLARSADELRKLLYADEVTHLFELYLDWVQERSPISAARTAEEVKDLVEALGKGTQPLQSLSAFDSVSLRIIATELVARLRTSMSSPSSPTSPSSGTETSSSGDSD